jgi:hypothetical protein
VWIFPASIFPAQTASARNGRGLRSRRLEKTGGTNLCVAYRRSGYGGAQTFFILGDPNATKLKRWIMTKVIGSI